MEFFPNQQHEIVRAIDIGLKKAWGKKTERRLENNGINEGHVKILRDLIFLALAKAFGFEALDPIYIKVSGRRVSKLFASPK